MKSYSRAQACRRGLSPATPGEFPFTSSTESSKLVGMLKPLLLVTGLLATVLGFLGMFLPVLPTTPFLLLAAYCFARSSTRLHNYLIHHRQLGPYLSNYYNKAMTPKDKARTLTLMWGGILVSAALIGSPIAWIVLPTVATAVMIHILRLAPRPDKSLTTLREDAVEDAPRIEPTRSDRALTQKDRHLNP